MRRTRMFALHESTRRLICRAAFLMLCLLPTLTITGWVCVVRSPVYQAARLRSWQQALSQQWGLTVTLQSVQNPRRGLTLLERVRLVDPETGLLLAEVRQIELGQHRGQLVVLASQPEIQGDQIWRLWEAFHERLLRSQSGECPPAQFYAGELTVHHAAGGASTLTEVRCQVTPVGDGPQATFEFLDVALKMAEPARLRVTRNRQLSPPATRWELNTRSTALPCSLLAAYLPAVQWLGPDATFQGSVDAVRSRGGWSGELTGRFREVDLERLVTERYDHRLSGTAEILFRRARFDSGKLLDAAGELASNGGSVSRSLLAQADRTLGLAADARVRTLEAVPIWWYRELRFGFAIDQEGLRLVGHCGRAGEGVVMADADGPLLSDRPQQVAQVVALVQTLASRSGQQVPATPEAYQLLHVLPAPARSETPTLASPGPFASPLRLRLQ